MPFYVRIFEHDFVDDKERIRRHTLCLARIFDAVNGIICKKDVRKKILNRLSHIFLFLLQQYNLLQHTLIVLLYIHSHLIRE